jgi:sulfite reductase alpha subunit-like flavoprotein
MTAESSDRTVIHVELDVADSGMRFNAGDAVGVLPQNAAPLVTGLLARLGLDGDAVFEVQPASGERGFGLACLHAGSETQVLLLQERQAGFAAGVQCLAEGCCMLTRLK